MLKESIELHRQGRFDEAEQGYRAELEKHPDDVGALHLLGMLRHQLGDADEGSRLLERAHALAPNDANIELSLASLAFRNGDHAAARIGFERALNLDPNLAGAHAGAGQIALLRGEHVLAEQHFRIALRANEEPHALAGLGALLLERGDIDGALRHLGRAADLAPTDAMIQMLLGRAFVQRGTPAFAEQAFANALRQRPDMHQVRAWMGELLLNAKRSAEAEQHYRPLLDVPAFAAVGNVGLADVARAQNRLDDAVASYRAALVIEPVQATPVRALAWTLTRLGRGEEAIAAYDAYLTHAPDDHEVQTARADLLMLFGRLIEAEADWKRLLDRDPADLQARSRIALIAEHRGQSDEAHAQAERVLKGQPDNSEMRLIRLRALMRADNNAAARVELDALGAQPLSEGQARLRLNYLGRLHDRAGEVTDALRCFAEAQRGTPANMPVLAEPNLELQAALAEEVGPAWSQAPILLLGTPGSGAERVAALLADQPQLTVLRDRIGALMRKDDFNEPRFQHYCSDLNDAERLALRERYLAPLRAANVPMDRPIVDWLPRWDAHLLALIRRAMPGTRLVLVERDPRDALLNWLAFGWAQGFPCSDVDAAVEWLRRARRHLAFGSELPEPRRLVVAADALLDDAQRHGGELARFLGMEALKPGAQLATMERGLGGLPQRFAAGHWQQYGDALAQPFARLLG